MVKRWWIAAAIIVAAVAVALLINYGGKGDENIKVPIMTDNLSEGNQNRACQQDSDCVPDACCHPRGCVTNQDAPACKSILCTQECAPGTLDCGQGSCVCENNLCSARFNQ